MRARCSARALFAKNTKILATQCAAGVGIQASACGRGLDPRLGRRSILWNSPLGPLRLDIAKAFMKEKFDDEQLIRFGASTKF